MTATATPKVQTDILKSLEMHDPNVLSLPSIRQPLYEIRPKVNKDKTVKHYSIYKIYQRKVWHHLRTIQKNQLRKSPKY